MPNSEAVVAKNCEPQHATNANGHSIHGEVAYLSCVQEDYDLQTSRASQSIETGTSTQASHDGDSRSRDPLHNEFDRIRGEMVHAAKNQEDLRTKLKSDCEKEIQETVAEIRNRYNARLQESETKYSLRKSELGGNMKKVLLNKLLADTFRIKCEEDLRPSRIVTMWQAIPTSFMQHLHQLSVQPTLQSAYLTGFSSPGWQTSVPASVRPPTTASPSAEEQTSISETMRVPSHSLPSGGQESATAPYAVGSPRRLPPSSIYLPPARQQNFSIVQSRTPTIASPSAGEQTSISETTRVPIHSLPSGGQESATAPSAVESPRRPPPPPSTVQSRSPSIASSSSAGEQTPASATTKPPSFSLCSGGQQLATSQPAMFNSATVDESSRRPSRFWSLPARQRNSSMVWTRSPLNASSSAGEPTSTPAITRPTSFSLSSGGQQLATSQPTLSKSATVDESPRRPTPPPTIALPQASSQQSSSAVWSQSPSIALSLGGQPVAGQQTPVSSRCSMFGKSSRASNNPPVICSITPSSGNLRRGDIRAPAPHLQSFKPSRFSLASSNFPPSDPPSLNHDLPLPSADSSQSSQPKEHAEPNNRTSLQSANVSAMELLRNLEDSLGRLSAVQQKQSGRQGFCAATNSLSPSSSTSSPNHSPCQTKNFESSSLSQDKEQQLPPAGTDDNNHDPKAVPFSELLRNLDNLACLNQSTNGLPSLPKTNHGTEGSSIQEGSSSAPPSTDVVCLSTNEE
ncbi:unnamed protein product [Cuscuta campestris]|uniref:Uncharacterized protein n=1 Tax=Cuscuta campestris TaxID=132261 RepID=A0A484MRK7_9ASTE|nr:unnamed protein product [Cuscuta campestris]